MCSNLRRDKFLQAEQAKQPEGYVSLKTLLTFNKLKALTTDAAAVAAVCRAHRTLQGLLTVSPAGDAVNRTLRIRSRGVSGHAGHGPAWRDGEGFRGGGGGGG